MTFGPWQPWSVSRLRGMAAHLSCPGHGPRLTCLWCVVLGVGLAVAGCGSRVEQGEVHLVSEGETLSAVAPPLEPAGGVVEMARVWFAGNGLSTGLLGDPEPFDADGWTLTAGAARFVYPRSEHIESAAWLLPSGPGLEDGESMRCAVVLGAGSGVQQSEVSVDAGDVLRFSDAGGKVSYRVVRRPLFRDTSPWAAVSYFALERTLSPDDLRGPGNWFPGTALTLSMGGANPTEDRRFASLPFAFESDRPVLLPLKLSGLTLNGAPVAAPVRSPDTGDVVVPGPAYALPTAGVPLEIGWDAWSTPQTMVVSLEYYGGGDGRCPSACNQGVSCCESDDQCGDDETCGVRPADGRKVCLPRHGDGRDRLGALVCTVQDTGRAVLAAGQVEDLEAQLSARGTLDWVQGVVLRIGRTVTASVALPDVMLADGSGRSISPVRIRASDVALVRLERVAE